METSALPLSPSPSFPFLSFSLALSFSSHFHFPSSVLFHSSFLSSCVAYLSFSLSFHSLLASPYSSLLLICSSCLFSSLALFFLLPLSFFVSSIPYHFHLPFLLPLVHPFFLKPLSLSLGFPLLSIASPFLSFPLILTNFLYPPLTYSNVYNLPLASSRYTFTFPSLPFPSLP